MTTPAPCICGRYTFGGLFLTIGLAAHRAYCPVCKTPVLIVRRGTAHVVTLRFEDERPEQVLAQLRIAQLAGVALADAEVEDLGAVAFETAGVIPPLQPSETAAHRFPKETKPATERTGVRRPGVRLPAANPHDR
ncbi:MAG TPA: hypothetical protein VFJ16_08265 [Longimicrobium sp.]|nr:hypothetical protein [Longimicrobium sp.]